MPKNDLPLITSDQDVINIYNKIRNQLEENTAETLEDFHTFLETMLANNMESISEIATNLKPRFTPNAYQPVFYTQALIKTIHHIRHTFDTAPGGYTLDRYTNYIKNLDLSKIP